MPAPYDTFFQTATGNVPYAYQRRLACGEPSRTAGAGEGPAPSGPFPRHSHLISITTGLGKTAAVILAWLESLHGDLQAEVWRDPA